ncbi:hypothetical protein [Amycolatopsis sp. cg13]|uniref:hypothetical protein n=1 Tax=Amycolatopsis sp. cg13 TaxID=3238807 RepID=UPI0035260304
MLDDERCIQALEHDGVNVEEGDREKTRRNVRHVSPRPVGGGIRWLRGIPRMVEAAMRCPSRRSSPWMRTTPQVRFSIARRTISVVISSLIGGRPGGFGWRHCLDTSRRCHHSNVAA